METGRYDYGLRMTVIVTGIAIVGGAAAIGIVYKLSQQESRPDTMITIPGYQQPIVVQQEQPCPEGFKPVYDCKVTETHGDIFKMSCPSVCKQ